MSYEQNIIDIMRRQSAKGIAEYGQRLEDNPAEMWERINHLEEELIDAAKYCEWMKDQLPRGYRPMEMEE